MKKAILILLCAAMLFSIFGCAADKPVIVQPVEFYYRTANASYDGSASVIGFEERESVGFDGNMPLLLNAYFRGPTAEELVSPFPKNLKAVSYSIVGSTVLLELSNELALLSGIDLTIACACVTGTILSIEETAERVQISVSGSYLNGSDAISMDQSNILFLDPIDLPTEPEETEPKSTQ